MDSQLFPELLGYTTENPTNIPKEQVHETKSGARFCGDCPFKEGFCNKSPRSDDSLDVSRALGVCSTNSKEGTPVITCPNRFYDDSALGAVKDYFFDESSEDVAVEMELSVGNAGNADLAFVSLDENDNIGDIVAGEIQTSYTTTEKITPSFREFMDAHNKGENPGVPEGDRPMDYRSCIDKRLLPQLHEKVNTLNCGDVPMAVIVQDIAFQNSVITQRVTPVTREKADVFWFSFSYTPDDPHYMLQLEEVVPTTIEDIEKAQGGGFLEDDFLEFTTHVEKRIDRR